MYFPVSDDIFHNLKQRTSILNWFTKFHFPSSKIKLQITPHLEVFIDLTIMINILNYIIIGCDHVTSNCSLMIFTAFCQWNRLFSSESEKLMFRIGNHQETQIWTLHKEIFSIKLIRKQKFETLIKDQLTLPNLTWMIFLLFRYYLCM